MTIEPTSRQATFPWFETAQEAIADDGVGIDDLLDDPDHGTVRRAVERIDTAIEDGTVGPPALDAADELCSYPVARVIVSHLTDEVEAIVPAFAAAEARTFRERTMGRIESSRNDLTLADVVAEFDVTVTQDADDEAQLYVAVEDYLQYAPDPSLTEQPVANGNVPVSRTDLLDILESACRERVAANLPHDLSDAVRGSVEPVASALRQRLSRESAPTGFPVVSPGSLPPCLGAALRDVQAGDELHHTAQLALVEILTACGMDAAAISTLTGGGLSEPRVSVIQRHVTDADGGLLYEPPTCETMIANGCCVDPDDVCDTISSPHGYYQQALDDDDASE